MIRLRSTALNAKPVDLIRAEKELQLESIIAKRKGSLYERNRHHETAFLPCAGNNPFPISLRT